MTASRCLGDPICIATFSSDIVIPCVVTPGLRCSGAAEPFAAFACWQSRTIAGSFFVSLCFRLLVRFPELPGPLSVLGCLLPSFTFPLCLYAILARMQGERYLRRKQEVRPTLSLAGKRQRASGPSRGGSAWPPSGSLPGSSVHGTAP